MNRKFLLIAVTIAMFILSSCQDNNVADNNIYTGTVEADQYTLSAEVTGKVTEVKAIQGSIVKEGDSLIKIDIEMYRLQKEQALGVLKIAEAKEEALTSNASENTEKEARGGVEQAQATVDLAQLQINKGNVKSSIAGTITELFVQKGEYVAMGSPLAQISDLNNLYVKIYVEESKRDRIKIEDKLTIISNNKELSGKVMYISPKSEFTPKNVETKDEKAKTLFEVKLQLPQGTTSSVGSMVDITLD